MLKLWKTHGLDDVCSGECGPQMKRCWNDVVITSMGHLSEEEMKEQITIRMIKIMHRPPPHCSTQDSKLTIRHTISGLLDFVISSDDLKDEDWQQQTNPHIIVVGDQITGSIFHLTYFSFLADPTSKVLHI
jgi:hypothetical protein